ncbi:hypothetical protein J437_LFUL009033 [Ladona fulva]|uniref:Peptidoglycan-recognition protein n=1 Tax=Ladona fulva TaxID=123851 RepID=A0A8K0K8L9_LADFU|nr:hypothetical protein J437_LFUL009033 [Ladona fulva]
MRTTRRIMSYRPPKWGVTLRPDVLLRVRSLGVPVTSSTHPRGQNLHHNYQDPFIEYSVKYLPETSTDPCGFGSCAFRWAIGLSIVALVVIAIAASLVTTFGEKEKAELVTREQWGGLPPKHPADNLTVPTPYVIISHTATDFCSTLEECAAVVRSVQTYHMKSRNWWDIGYNFLVGGDGRAYEGRGWDAIGAHAKSYNNVSIGLSFIGTFIDVEPTEAQVNAAKWLIQEGVRLGKVDKDYVLLAHRQVSPTESPGEKLFEMMKQWPHWSELLS